MSEKKTTVRPEGRRALFEGVADAAIESGNESASADPLANPDSVLGSRLQSAKSVSSGEIERRNLRRVDPDSCRIWPGNARRYELLNEQRCESLIEGFRTMGGQQFPAVVRAVQDSSEYQWEVICGARRHWTSAHLGMKYLVEVRDLTDEHAFLLADIENRDHEDISDYERALGYRAALDQYYSTQKQMAQRMEVSQAWLSRFLDLADLPEPIVKAYADLTEIKVNHARDIGPYLKRTKDRQQLLDRAAELQGNPLSGAALVAELLTSVKPKSAARTHPEAFRDAEGRTIFKVTRGQRGDVSLQIRRGEGVSKQSLTDAFEKLVETLDI